MNDTNNNLNGTVLGEVNTNNINNNPMPTDNVEMLDMGVPTEAPIQNQNQNQVQQTNTYFNTSIEQNQNNTPNANNNAQVIEQAVSQPEPALAYTSLQSINPTPMPGFESSGTIGTTPPISLEPEKQPKKKKSNKILFVILVLIVLAGVGFGTYYVLNYTDLLSKQSEIKIDTNNLEISLGDSLSDDIEDYAKITGTDVKNCSLDTTKVDIDNIGEYTYKITCGKTEKSGKIVVIDNKKEEIITKTVYKVSGDDLTAEEFINDVNSEYTYEILEIDTVKSYLSTEGSYDIKIKITNKDDKTEEVNAKLVVLQYAIKGYLTCSSNGQNIENSSAMVTHSIKSAIAKDNENQNIYGKVAFETYSYKYSDETEYANLLAQYKSEGKITINNISGETTFDDETFTISISNEKSNDDLIKEYGEATFDKYSTIKTYFETTKGYSCIYKNESN